MGKGRNRGPSSPIALCPILLRLPVLTPAAKAGFFFYRPQSSSASRFTAGAMSLLIAIGGEEEPLCTGSQRGQPMWTTILVYVLVLAGVVMIAAGAWGARILITDYQNNIPVPARYYAIMIGAVAGGLGLIGLAQALRLLLLIYGKA